MGRFGGGGGNASGAAGGGFGPRGPGFFGDNFYGNFDMPYGGGFDHGYGYGGMGPMEFGPMGFPPPPRMPGWGGRGGMRGGYGMGSYPPGSGYGRGNGRMDARWAYGGFSRPSMGRGYDRGQFKGYEPGPEANRPYDYERVGEGYGRPGQGPVEQGGPYPERLPADRSYAAYKDRYPGEGYSGGGTYTGSKEDWTFRMYGGRSNPEAQYAKYESGHGPGMERTEGDVRGGYSGYRQGGEERGREYGDYARGAVEEDRAPRDYGRSAYVTYAGNATTYTKQAAAGEQAYDYEKAGARAGNEDYAKYRSEDVYGRTERAGDGYTTQDRREYDYNNTRTDARTYSGSGGGGGVDYKAREADYYADRRGDYGNSRAYRDDDPRGAGGADRHRSRSHRTVPYER